MSLIITLAILAALALDYLIAREFSEIARMKGHFGRQYFWWSFLFTIVGWTMAVALPDRRR